MGYTETSKPILNIYYDREPTEEETELMRNILGEFCVEPVLGPEDLPVKVNFLVAHVSPSELEPLDDFLYLRRE